MTLTQYCCTNENRRELVRSSGALNGIDYLEVISADQLTIEVRFLFPLPGQPSAVPDKTSALTKDNVVIEGGTRVRSIEVQSVQSKDNVLTVVVSYPGDFSTYNLRLVTSGAVAAPPAGFDPQLANVPFSFKAGCESDFDCKSSRSVAEPTPASPVIDYLAKDYASFRRLMLDRLSVTLPGWRERNPADLQIALVELLAYVGDHLSYAQDAVATEAYLGTARKRVSVRRHARLLNYSLHDGVNARTWLQIDVQPGSPADNYLLPSGTPALAQAATETPSVASINADKLLASNITVFETKHDVLLRSANNLLAFYTWGDEDCCLPVGSTRATLRNISGAAVPDLHSGDLLLFEEVADSVTGSSLDANPAHRHVVRLRTVQTGTDPLDGKPAIAIEWFEADALPFALRLTAALPGSLKVIETAVVRGNIVLADHGLTLPPQDLVPAAVTVAGDYLPRLANLDVTFASAFSQQSAVATAAAGLLRQEARKSLPQVKLVADEQTWNSKVDLLSSDRFSPDFVLETEKDGSAKLRFGDGVLGLAPAAGSRFTATYRVGSGASGNVGANSLRQIVSATKGILHVWNPLPAAGGTDPEALDDARQFAPQSFRTQQRAVTAEDYAEIAMRHPQVRGAAARFRWTGSWLTVFVTIDRRSGPPVEMDEGFQREMQAYFDAYRMAGYDVEIKSPVYVPLELKLASCVKPGYFQTDVRNRLFEAFSSTGDGFFASGKFTFGQPVYLSQIYERAMRVPGVASVLAKTFQRFGTEPLDDLDVITVAPLEIVRLDNDPSFPENGKLEFLIGGGI